MRRICALTCSSIGPIREGQDISALIEDVMQETIAVGRAGWH